MEFMDGTWKKEINTWEELVGNNLLNQEAVIEGAVHSIRNMGDVAFIILRRREGLFQTVYENEMANVSIHELKEAMTIRVKGILHEEERAPHGRELRIRHIDILSTPAEPLPMAIDKWKLNTSLEAKLNYRPISLRNIQERSKFKNSGGTDKSIPRLSLRTGIHRNPHSKDRSKRSRGWGKPFQVQLLPQTCSTCAEPTVLQTDDGWRI